MKRFLILILALLMLTACGQEAGREEGRCQEGRSEEAEGNYRTAGRASSHPA